MSDIDAHIRAAGEMARRHFDRTITFYLPGMFILDGITGSYPAVSITADKCKLRCPHCEGKVLAGMVPTETPEALLATCLRFWEKGHVGVLISGGCDHRGRLPWETHLEAIRTIKTKTDMIVSVHCGLIDKACAERLKDTGVDQALIDVIGDDTTFRQVYGLDGGVKRIATSMNALNQVGLSLVPHIVCGLNKGRIVGEMAAVDMLTRFDIDQLVVVSLMGIPGTAGWRYTPPKAEAVADIIARARLQMPRTPISLGCARQRGNHRIEILAIDAGINRMALPSEAAIEHARKRGLAVRYQKSCCSVAQDFSSESW